MVLENNIKENLENVNKIFENEMKMATLKNEVLKKFDDYKKTINYMAADAPIAVLCLPAVTENILISNGLLRVYDLFNVDFFKIKGLGVTRIRDLTSRIDQFLSVL